MRQGEPMPVTMTPEARELAPQVAQGIAEAALMFPTGASLPDAMGLQPDPLSDEYYSSMWENLRQGEYVDAALQGLGLGADALTAIGAAGTATGVGAPAGLAAMGAGVGLSGLSTAMLAARRADRVPVASAFSGAGTVEGGMPSARSVFAAENDPTTVAEFNRVHGTDYRPRDATRLDPAEIAEADPALFHASPVCKNFSCAKTLRGAEETDRQSAESVARVITEARPPAVSIENVPQYQGTAMYQQLIDSLEAGDYRWDAQIVNPADYGGVQNRKRLIVRAVRGDAKLPPLPEKTGPGDWYASVQDLIADAPPSTLGNVETQRINSMIDRGMLDPEKPIITMGGSGFRNTWAAANAGGPSPTLKSTPNEVPRIILPGGDVRRVTSRMMARLMSLPDDFPVPDRPQLAKQILGNGVEGNISRLFLEPLAQRGEQIKQSAPTPRREITPEEVAYNEQVRIPSGMLDRDRVLPNDNILYRPDRVYRYIGEGGYADFLESGMVRQKPKGEKTYPVTHYMRGKSSSRYARKESGKYLVEAVPNPEKWRAGGSEYTGSIVPLTAEDQIRIFRRNEDGTFDVVFDNIGDRALLTEPQPSAARGQEPSGSLREQTEQDMENMKNELREYLRNTPAQ